MDLHGTHLHKFCAYFIAWCACIFFMYIKQLLVLILWLVVSINFRSIWKAPAASLRLNMHLKQHIYRLKTIKIAIFQ